MTTDLAHGAGRRRLVWPYPVLPTVLLAVVVLRVLQFRDGAAPDEGGFLLLAGQWDSGGDSLYGDYWVDRPPLLLALFGVADFFGGVLALRILGTLIAVACVAGLHSTAKRVLGERAATYAAVAAGALISTPMYGSIDVNGELLSLPFVVLGIRMAVEAVLSDSDRTARLSALVAGAATVAALLVKQNIADVAIFAAVFWIFCWRSGRISWAGLAARVGFAAVGAVLGYALVMAWSLAHGTSPAEVYEATYPFRVKASQAIADNPILVDQSSSRLKVIWWSFVASGVPLVLGLFAVRGIRRTGHTAFVWSVVALTAWSAFSVLAGGSYWRHYLVESIPAISFAVGLCAVTSPVATRRVVALVAASSIAIGLGYAIKPVSTPGTTIGGALARVKQPGDTMTQFFGDAEAVRASGMQSPYRFLWSLPADTLDPRLDELRGVLEGPRAPTWVVVRDDIARNRLAGAGVYAVIEARYHRNGTLCDRAVWLLDGVDRPEPRATERC
ncbi:MAG: hypothetical protein NTV23_04575 [Propionibacteriales bacterium]|nr:hypothetical protein [Propionibacteriales bacterium]